MLKAFNPEHLKSLLLLKGNDVGDNKPLHLAIQSWKQINCRIKSIAGHWEWSRCVDEKSEFGKTIIDCSSYKIWALGYYTMFHYHYHSCIIQYHSISCL